MSLGGRGAEAPFALAAGELGGERVEPLLPEAAEAIEPQSTSWSGAESTA